MRGNTRELSFDRRVGKEREREPKELAGIKEAAIIDAEVRILPGRFVLEVDWGY